MSENERITPYPIKFGLSIIDLPKGSKIIGAGWSEKWHISPHKDHYTRLCIHVLHDINEAEKEFRGVLAVAKRKVSPADFDKKVLGFVSGEGAFKQKVESPYPSADDLNSCIFVGPPDEKFKEIPSAVLEQLVPLKD
jgi:hypothetical protein